VLLRQSARLRQSEHFVDATAVFDRESGAVYKDDCCHYNELGNRLLADAIAARVRELGPLGQRPQSSHSGRDAGRRHRTSKGTNHAVFATASFDAIKYSVKQRCRPLEATTCRASERRPRRKSCAT
jgi:hypothetical protein